MYSFYFKNSVHIYLTSRKEKNLLSNKFILHPKNSKKGHCSMALKGTCLRLSRIELQKVRFLMLTVILIFHQIRLKQIVSIENSH